MAADEYDGRDALQPKGLMGLSTALSTVEQIPLDVREDGEPGAASSVGNSLAVGTDGTLVNGST